MSTTTERTPAPWGWHCGDPALPGTYTVRTEKDRDDAIARGLPVAPLYLGSNPKPEGEAVAWRPHRNAAPGYAEAEIDPALYAHPAPEPVEGIREKVAAMAWRFRGSDRHGGPWYDGAKPTDSPAMADAFAFADAILSALSGSGGRS